MVAQLCLFGPHTIYAGSVAEFSAPFWTLVRPLLVAGAAVVLLRGSRELGVMVRDLKWME